MKQTEIPEALAATLIHLLPKEKISISDIEDILKETLLIFKSIPLDIPKPKKMRVTTPITSVVIFQKFTFNHFATFKTFSLWCLLWSLFIYSVYSGLFMYSSTLLLKFSSDIPSLSNKSFFCILIPPFTKSISAESVNVKTRRYYERISGFSAQSKQNSVHVYL